MNEDMNEDENNVLNVYLTSIILKILIFSIEDDNCSVKTRSLLNSKAYSSINVYVQSKN